MICVLKSCDQLACHAHKTLLLSNFQHIYVYIVVAGPRQESMRLACVNAVSCRGTATNLLEVTKQKACTCMS